MIQVFFSEPTSLIFCLLFLCVMQFVTKINHTLIVCKENLICFEKHISLFFFFVKIRKFFQELSNNGRQRRRFQCKVFVLSQRICRKKEIEIVSSHSRPALFSVSTPSRYCEHIYSFPQVSTPNTLYLDLIT